MDELNFIQQLLQMQQNGGGFLGSTPSGVTNTASAPATGYTTSASPGGVLNIANQGMSAVNGATEVASGFSKALPFIGLGLSAVSTLMSFSEAGKAADAQRAAQREVERQVAEKKRLLEQDYYEALRAPTEAYDRQFREGTAANAQAVEALIQDPRMLLGGIQGVQEATIEGQAKAREALADRLFNLDAMKAGAATQRNAELAKFAGEQAEGAQIAAMAAEKAKIAQQGQALQGVGNLITQGAGMIGTYGKMAKPEDNLLGLTSALGNTVFSKPSATQGVDQNMMAAFAQFLKNYKG